MIPLLKPTELFASLTCLGNLERSISGMLAYVLVLFYMGPPVLPSIRCFSSLRGPGEKLPFMLYVLVWVKRIWDRSVPRLRPRFNWIQMKCAPCSRAFRDFARELGHITRDAQQTTRS